MKRRFAGLVAGLLLLSGCDYVKFALNAPHDRNVLAWSVEQRDFAFRHLEDIPSLKYHEMKAGAQTHAFAQGAPLAIPYDVAGFMAHQRGVALMVVVDGKVRLQQFGMGYGPTDRWTSFSVAKSFTSTLLGAAIRDGYIKSVDEPVTDVIPEFKGTAYDGVSIRQILTMTSGVKWNEDYADPHSDVAQFDKVTPVAGQEAIVTYMRTLPREAAPGTKWVYKTGETNLIGAIVMRATHKSLAAYLGEKIWQPYGMEKDGFWVLDTTGHEIGGCCISATISDFARMGQFMLDGRKTGGKPTLPDQWIAQATHTQAPIGEAHRGYGYQWWTFDDGSYAARGLFGQGIFIDPARKIVIASNADYPTTHEGPLFEERVALYRAVQQAVDREQHVTGRAVVQ